jgi:flagellar hook-associated protein 3 FlgL
MSITRVTQGMLTQRSLTSVQNGLLRMSQAEEQLSTGRKINRPSDDPTGTTTALRARVGVANQTQYQRNGQDGLGWLSTIDSTLQGMSDQVRRAYTLALQGADTGSNGQTALDSLASEVDQIKGSLIDAANTTYLGRPVFGGTTSGSTAYDSSGNYVGDDGQVLRRVGDGNVVRVDTSGPAAFGDQSQPATSADSTIFQHLDALSTALRGGDSTAITTQIANLQSDMTRISTSLAKEGAAYNQITTAGSVASSNQLTLKKTQNDVENVDVAEATIALATQQTAYQAALAATSKTMQPSLLDFLR